MAWKQKLIYNMDPMQAVQNQEKTQEKEDQKERLINEYNIIEKFGSEEQIKE